MKSEVFMKSLLSFVVSFLFLLQNAAWANQDNLPKHSWPSKEQLLQRVVTYFNPLTPEQQSKKLNELIQYLSPEEQLWIKSQINVSKLKLPAMKAEGDRIIFNLAGEEHWLRFKEYPYVEFKGKTIDFSEGKMISALTEFTDLMTKKTVQYDEFFMSSAYADDKPDVGKALASTIGFGILAGALIGAIHIVPPVALVSATALIVGLVGYEMYTWTQKELSTLCDQMKKEKETIQGTEAEIEKLKKLIQKKKKEVESNPDCHSFLRKPDCVRIKSCLDTIASSLSTSEKAVNSEERGIGRKDDSRKGPKRKNKRSSTSKQ